MTDQEKKIRAAGARATRSIEDSIDSAGKLINSKAEKGRMMTLDQVDNLWDDLNSKTQKSYISMFSDIISSLDEKELISSKKAKSKERG